MGDPMSGDQRLHATRTIEAAPEQIFALLADPALHTGLDGAGMLRGLAAGPSPVAAVGDTFFMNMHQSALGDYQMRNEVTAFELNRLIAWAPSIHPPDALAGIIGDMDPSGYEFRWNLDPAADGSTEVTHTYDWSGVRDTKAQSLFPVVSTEQLEATLHQLAERTREL
jgi:hypothetical protein